MKKYSIETPSGETLKYLSANELEDRLNYILTNIPQTDLYEAVLTLLKEIVE